MTPREVLEQINAEIEALEERKRQLYEQSMSAPESEKLCEDSIAHMLAEPPFFEGIGYPLEVSGISLQAGQLLKRGYPKRELVCIRPCAAEFEGKTFLGLYLGDLARSMGCSINRKTGVLQVYACGHNPAIWIPSLQRIVFGLESWWGPIESEDQLAEITDESIGKVWYVQATKAMLGNKSPGDAKG